jgi:hypothetical protein
MFDWRFIFLWWLLSVGTWVFEKKFVLLERRRFFAAFNFRNWAQLCKLARVVRNQVFARVTLLCYFHWVKICLQSLGLIWLIALHHVAVIREVAEWFEVWLNYYFFWGLTRLLSLNHIQNPLNFSDPTFYVFIGHLALYFNVILTKFAAKRTLFKGLCAFLNFIRFAFFDILILFFRKLINLIESEPITWPTDWLILKCFIFNIFLFLISLRLGFVHIKLVRNRQTETNFRLLLSLFKHCVLFNVMKCKQGLNLTWFHTY